MDGGQRWGRIGGHVVLDLADTISWRLDDARRIDHTPDFPRLVEWAGERGLTSPDETLVLTQAGKDDAAAARATTRIHQLRDVVIRAAEVQNVHDHGEVVRVQVRDALTVAVVSAELPLRWLITMTEPEDLARRLAIETAAFLSQRHPQLRICAGPGCGWIFLDTSRNHSRRWCDPADCGNRVRVARHARKSIQR